MYWNSELVTVPSAILVASIAALALTSALTIVPSTIFAEVIWESAMWAVSIDPSTYWIWI